MNLNKLNEMTDEELDLLENAIDEIKQKRSQFQIGQQVTINAPGNYFHEATGIMKNTYKVKMVQVQVSPHLTNSWRFDQLKN